MRFEVPSLGVEGRVHGTCAIQVSSRNVVVREGSDFQFKFQIPNFKFQIREFLSSRKVVVRERGYVPCTKSTPPPIAVVLQSQVSELVSGSVGEKNSQSVSQ